MSKSLGNGIDPIEVIDKYGADALRLSLITGNAPGNDMRFYWEKVESSRNFGNKIWNASRFILMNMESTNILEPKEGPKELADIWVESRLNKVIEEINVNLESFDFGIAVQKIHDFIWNEFCDWYIELAKQRLYSDDMEAKESVLYTLTSVLSDALKLLHPFMPFITEELWQHLPHEGESIMVSQWPAKQLDKIDEVAESAMESIMEAIRNIRNIRAEMNVPPKQKSNLYILTDESNRKILADNKSYFIKLAMAADVIIIQSKEEAPENAVALVSGDIQLFMPLNELVDIESEIARLNDEKTKLEGELKRVNGKLSNERFVNQAPEDVVKAEKDKKEKYQSMMEKVLEQIDKYATMAG
jgi:valyl-tRNA synthetase